MFLSVAKAEFEFTVLPSLISNFTPPPFPWDVLGPLCPTTPGSSPCVEPLPHVLAGAHCLRSDNKTNIVFLHTPQKHVPLTAAHQFNPVIYLFFIKLETLSST